MFVSQNEPLFKRIGTVYNSPDKKALTPEQQRLAWLYYTNFVRSGARLDPKAKARLSEINQQLAGLFTKSTYRSACRSAVPTCDD